MRCEIFVTYGVECCEKNRERKKLPAFPEEIRREENVGECIIAAHHCFVSLSLVFYIISYTLLICLSFSCFTNNYIFRRIIVTKFFFLNVG